MHPNFPDPPASPFFAQVELVPAYFGLNVDTIAQVAGVGVAVAMGAHAINHVIKRRSKTKTSEAEKAKGGSQ